MAMYDPATAEPAIDQRRPEVVWSGQVLLASSALGAAETLILFTGTDSASVAFGGLFTALTSLVLGTVGAVYAIRGRGGPAGAWVLVTFVVCLGFCGLPSTTMWFSTRLSNVTAANADRARANAEALAAAVPGWLGGTTAALAAAQLVLCVIAAVRVTAGHDDESSPST